MDYTHQIGITSRHADISESDGRTLQDGAKPVKIGVMPACIARFVYQLSKSRPSFTSEASMIHAQSRIVRHVERSHANRVSTWESFTPSRTLG
jgi:hypothetical protein